MEIIIPIGISGSGKSRLYKMKYSHLELVSPDLIRKELTGDISDQSKNKEVFDIVDKRVKSLVEEGKSFFYDATNVNKIYREAFVNQFEGESDIKIIYVILPANPELSKERIDADISNGVDRSDVPVEAIIRQKHMYDESIRSQFVGENVHEVIFIKKGELE